MTNDDLLTYVQRIITKWTNMSGFLCALGGVATDGGRNVRPMSTVPLASSVGSLNMYSSTSSIARSSSFTSHDQLSVSTKGRSRFRLSVNMGSYCSTEDSSVSNCSLFIDDLVSLLTCVNERVGVKFMKVRETEKEVLSYGSSPAMYPYFFQKIDCMLQGKEKIQTSDQQTTFIDLITMIIQHILESRSETSTIAMVNVKVDLIISKLVSYVDQLLLSQQAFSMSIARNDQAVGKLCGIYWCQS